MSSFLMVTLTIWFTQGYARQLHEHCIHLAARSTSSECNLYTVCGQDTNFENYAFFDFRGLSNYSITEPPSVTSEESQGQGNITSAYFNQPLFSDYWELRRGVRNAESDVPMIYSAHNAYISSDSDSVDPQTYLKLRTTRLQNFQSVVQLVSRQNLLHGSMRIRMKIIPDSKDGGNIAQGAVLGFFTYASDTQESDIEVLTKDPGNIVQLTTQPVSPTIPGENTDVEIPNGRKWTDWVEYRLDWSAGKNIWYLDGQRILSTNKSVPTIPSALMLNLWSNGQSFSGEMHVGREVYVAVQWIEMIYNMSIQTQTLKQPDDLTICSADSVGTKGIPEVIQGSSAMSGAGSTVLDMFFIIMLFWVSWCCT